MKSVLMIGARYDIPTDGQIVKGIEYLLNEASEAEPLSIHYEPYVDAPTNELTLKQIPTHIIVCGSPWLWDGMEHSQKFSNVLSLKRSYPNAQVMFCGIGACLPLGKKEDVLARLRLARLDELFGGATIIARDDITADFLKVKKLPCPAYFAPRYFAGMLQGERLGNYPLAVWYDPRLGVSSSEWQDANKFNNYVEIYRDFIKKNPTLEVVCVNENEVASGEKLLGERVRKLDNVYQADSELTCATKVLSGRVHLAIPAHAMGKPTKLIPVDTRAEAFDPKLTPNDLEESKEEYVQIFKEFLR